MSGNAKAIGGAALGALFTLVAVVGVSAIRNSASDTAAVPDAMYIPAAQPTFSVPPAPAIIHERVAQQSVAPASVAPTVIREAPRVDTPPHGRSWQKTAMVIGGSAAAGAGVGGLVGGRKGALLGAAIGGGASTIFESTKR